MVWQQHIPNAAELAPVRKDSTEDWGLRVCEGLGFRGQGMLSFSRLESSDLSGEPPKCEVSAAVLGFEIWLGGDPII